MKQLVISLCAALALALITLAGVLVKERSQAVSDDPVSQALPASKQLPDSLGAGDLPEA